MTLLDTPTTSSAGGLSDASTVATTRATNADAMARPWRLGVVGLGVASGLALRLLSSNGAFDLLTGGATVGLAMAGAITGIGLNLVASERDRFGPSVAWTVTVVALAFAALQWTAPFFSDRVTSWDTTEQLALTALGFGNGLTLAGILTLAFVRRWPTLTSALTLVAGVLVLASNTVLLRVEWPAIGIVALAFIVILVAWDQSPREEPHFTAPDGSPRVSRAALCLATLALCGAAIQIWLSRSDTSTGNATTGAVAAGVLIVAAFATLIGVRREIQRRTTTMSEWTSWMREIRTRDFRGELESLATNDEGAQIGDLTSGPVPALSFPDLRTDDSVFATLYDDEGRDRATDEFLAAAGADHERFGTGTVDLPTASLFDQASLFEPPADADVDGALPAPTVSDRIDAPVASIETPLPGSQRLPGFDDLVWADDDWQDDMAPATGEVPVVSAPSSPMTEPWADDITPKQVAPPPMLTADSPTSEPEPAALLVPAPLAEPPAPSAPEPSQHAAATSGAFSSWLDDAPSALVGLDELAGWLSAAGPARAERLVVAVETMSLADFDMLPDEVCAAMTTAMLDLLASVVPSPQLVAPVDGPYLLMAWEHMPEGRLVELNATIQRTLATPVDTSEGAVAMDGTLAMLRIAPTATLESVIDDAVVGLTQARHQQAVAAAATR